MRAALINEGARFFLVLSGVFKTIEFTAPPITTLPQGNAVQRYELPVSL
jgi:hypothetical protein